MDKLKAWVKDRKEIFDVRSIDFVDKFAYVGNGCIQIRREFNELQFIRPTGFRDINGDNRELWEGDIMRTAVGNYGVVLFDKKWGSWVVRFVDFRAYLMNEVGSKRGTKYVGSIYTTPELVPWWKGEDNG